MVLIIGCSKEIDDLNNTAQDPKGTITLDMVNSSEKIDNTISIVDGNFTGALFVTLGKVQGLSAVANIPKTGWVNKLAAVQGHGYIAYSPSKKTYWRLYVSTYDDLGVRVIVKFQHPFIGSEKEMKPKTEMITLTGTEVQTIEFSNATLFPFSWSFEEDKVWCTVAYSRPDETAPYNSIIINAIGNNPELTPRECTLVLKSDIGKDVKIIIVQAASSFLEGSLEGYLYNIVHTDDSFVFKSDTIPALGKKVYIALGDELNVVDDTNAGLDGYYCFHHLREGSYAVYALSELVGGQQHSEIQNVIVGAGLNVVPPMYIHSGKAYGTTMIKGIIHANYYHNGSWHAEGPGVGVRAYICKAGEESPFDDIRAGANGVFVFQKLLPGDYIVYVVTEDKNLESVDVIPSDIIHIQETEKIYEIPETFEVIVTV
ncbi:hypothetical protein FACS189440_07670 [Bacteroidia bacterium]|nr:hypothetical protein FACS189440_07670 [Bacteroidia bacterium]